MFLANDFRRINFKNHQVKTKSFNGSVKKLDPTLKNKLKTLMHITLNI